VVPRPSGKSVVISKWPYKIKPTTDGSIKVKFVTRDFSQKEGIIYDKILTSIGIFISLIAVFDLELHQIDVKTIFLNSRVEQEAIHGKESHRLLQALRAWYESIDNLSTESWVHLEHYRSQYLYKDCTNSSCYLRMICSLQERIFFDSSD
jgi:hypothetical protein